MGLCGYGKNHQAGSIHIQAMHGRLCDHFRQATAQSRCRTILFVRASSRYGKETARFIDNYYLLVPVEDYQLRIGVQLPSHVNIIAHLCLVS